MTPDRYVRAFRSLKEEKRSGFIPFTIMGDPDFKKSLDIVRAFTDSGADIVELGLPFSDPIADGPVNQRAGLRALERGMNTGNMMRFIERVRRFTDVPVGLLCYYNPVLQYGIRNFYAGAASAGADSVLVADSAVEEASLLCEAAEKARMGTVFILSELSDRTRIKKTAEKTTAFIYLVSRLGVTGVRHALSPRVRPLVRLVRGITDRPLCVGFGISAPEQVKRLRQLKVEGVICGSAIVKKIEENLKSGKKMIREISAFVRSMRRACG